MKTKVFFFLTMFVLPAVAQAVAIGAAPSTLEVEAVRGEQTTASVQVMRSGAAQDEWFSVSTVNDEMQAIVLSAGPRVRIPAEKESAVYTFTIDTNKLTDMDVYETGIRFVSDRETTGIEGNTIYYGVTVQIVVTLLDEPTPLMLANEFIPEKDSSVIGLSPIDFVSGDSDMTGSFLVSNTGETSLKNIPYRLDINGNDGLNVSENRLLVGPVAAGAEVQETITIPSSNDKEVQVRISMAGQMIDQTYQKKSPLWALGAGVVVFVGIGMFIKRGIFAQVR